MSFATEFREDIDRYLALQHRQFSHLTAFRVVLHTQGLWALMQYRLATSISRGSLPKPVRALLLHLLGLWQIAVQITTGITLPREAIIGRGLYIGHFGCITVGEGAIIGNHCNISQGVTIGVSGLGDRRGYPRIGDRVYIMAHATVVGKIVVGNDVAIGANSLVKADVPDHVTVLGVPAVVVSHHGSAGYIY